MCVGGCLSYVGVYMCVGGCLSYWFVYVWVCALFFPLGGVCG